MPKLSAPPPPPSLRLRVDTEALAANWRTLAGFASPHDGVETAVAVKANCYGLGVDMCVPVLRDAGASLFFVAHWGEVATVAKHVPPEQIVVLHGPTTSGEVAYAKTVGALPAINSVKQAKLWNDQGGGRCHLMVDTGINRLGVSLEELNHEMIQALEIDLLMSHLACADEDSSMNARQLTAFQTCSSQISHKRLSLANSAGIALGGEYHFDVLRPGLALYGGVPRSEFAGKIQQVAHIEAALIQTRRLQAGDCVGYNATFTAEHDMPVGVVSLGYADGFLRSWAGKDAALRRDGKDFPILGKVSMDMIVVDLSTAPELTEGDWLEVPYSLPEASQQSGLSQYELLTVLGQRFQK